MSLLNVVLMAALAQGVPAQSADGDGAVALQSDTAGRAIAAVPFGIGERLVYDASVGLFGTVGSGSLEVVGTETIRGAETYHLRFGMNASALLGALKVNDVFQSWLDVSRLRSLRFKQDQKEPFYERHRTYEFFNDRQEWRIWENGRSGTIPTDRPLDDVSFLYYVRTLPLEVGETYTIPHYFKEDGNPVVVKVLRKQTVTVPAGTFETVVVQPIIKTDGLFGEGGNAEVFFTDDHRRLLVLLKSSIPALKTLELRLRSYTPGRPLGQPPGR